MDMNNDLNNIINLIESEEYHKAISETDKIIASSYVKNINALTDRLVDLAGIYNENRNHAKALKVLEILSLLEKYIDDIKKKNIILNEYEIAKGLTVLKSKPRFLQVVLTTDCNLDCIMCGLSHSNHNLSKRFKESILEYLPFVENVIWQGGEPLLFKDFIELFDVSAKNNVFQTITTNGLLINDDILQIIENTKSNINLDISIDAVDKTTYEKIRRKGNFDILTDKIKLIGQKNLSRKPNFRFGMQAVIMKSNYKQIDSMIDFALQNGFNKIMFQRLYPGYLAQNEELNISENNFVCDCIDNYVKKLDSENMKFGIESNIKRIILSHNETGNDIIGVRELKKQDCETDAKDNGIFCLAPWKRLFIGRTNIVMPVCHCDVEGLRIDDESDLWNGNTMVYFREQILKKSEPPQCKTFCQTSGKVFENIRRTGK